MLNIACHPHVMLHLLFTEMQYLFVDRFFFRSTKIFSVQQFGRNPKTIVFYNIMYIPLKK